MMKRLSSILFWTSIPLAVVLGFAALVAAENAMSPLSTIASAASISGVDDVRSERQKLSATASATTFETPVISAQPPAPLSTPDPTRLASHLLVAMRSWADEKDKRAANFAAIAHDIAEVALSERPVFDGDESRGRTGILLAAIALFEGSHYRAYVDEGKCNDPTWRASSAGARTMAEGGDCDGGVAASLWQLHMGGGIVLFQDEREWTYAALAGGSDVVTKIDAIADRRKAARVALHMARRSIKHGARLCQYTAEGLDGLGCPKGDARLRLAETYSKRVQLNP